MVELSFLRKYEVVSECLAQSYQRQVEVFQLFSDNDSSRTEINRDILWSTVRYLRSDLVNIYTNLQTTLYSKLSCLERRMLENYESDLNNIVRLLEESTYLDIDGLFDNLVTAEYVIAQFIIDLIEKSSSRINLNYTLLDIVHEAGYAFQKFILFNVSYMDNEDISTRFERLSKAAISQLKQTLLAFKDTIFVEEFIHYSECSLEYLNRYLLHVKEIIDNQNSSEEMNELLSTISNYIVSHTSIISKAINSGNPFNSLLGVLDEFERQQLTALRQIINLVETCSPYDEDEDNGFKYHAVLFFTEVAQNLVSIDDIGKGFRLSRTN